MGTVTLTVAGRVHQIGCPDGQEPALLALADRLERHANAARRASGGQSGERTMLFLALMLADELVEAERRPSEGIAPELLDRIADRLEAVASALEDQPADA